MLLSESRCLLLIHLIASGSLCCPQLQRASLQVMVELQGTVKYIRSTSCEQDFFFLSYFLRFPFQDYFRVTEAANKLEANAKDSFFSNVFFFYTDKMERRK